MNIGEFEEKIKIKLNRIMEKYLKYNFRKFFGNKRRNGITYRQGLQVFSNIDQINFEIYFNKNIEIKG